MGVDEAQTVQPDDDSRRARRMDELALASGYQVDHEFVSLVTQETVTGQFVRDVLQADELSDDDRLRILITGLRALDGRDDLRID